MQFNNPYPFTNGSSNSAQNCAPPTNLLPVTGPFLQGSIFQTVGEQAGDAFKQQTQQQQNMYQAPVNNQMMAMFQNMMSMMMNNQPQQQFAQQFATQGNFLQPNSSSTTTNNALFSQQAILQQSQNFFRESQRQNLDNSLSLSEYAVALPTKSDFISCAQAPDVEEGAQSQYSNFERELENNEFIASFVRERVSSTQQQPNFEFAPPTTSKQVFAAQSDGNSKQELGKKLFQQQEKENYPEERGFPPPPPPPSTSSYSPATTIQQQQSSAAFPQYLLQTGAPQTLPAVSGGKQTGRIVANNIIQQHSAVENNKLQPMRKTVVPQQQEYDGNQQEDSIFSQAPQQSNNNNNKNSKGQPAKNNGSSLVRQSNTFDDIPIVGNHKNFEELLEEQIRKEQEKMGHKRSAAINSKQSSGNNDYEDDNDDDDDNIEQSQNTFNTYNAQQYSEETEPKPKRQFLKRNSRGTLSNAQVRSKAAVHHIEVIHEQQGAKPPATKASTKRPPSRQQSSTLQSTPSQSVISSSSSNFQTQEMSQQGTYSGESLSRKAAQGDQKQKKNFLRRGEGQRCTAAQQLQQLQQQQQQQQQGKGVTPKKNETPTNRFSSTTNDDENDNIQASSQYQAGKYHTQDQKKNTTPGDKKWPAQANTAKFEDEYEQEEETDYAVQEPRSEEDQGSGKKATQQPVFDDEVQWDELYNSAGIKNGNSESDNQKFQSRIVNKYFNAGGTNQQAAKNSSAQQQQQQAIAATLTAADEEQIALKYVAKKVEELNSQVERVKQESERLKKARAKCEEQLKQFNKQREDFAKQQEIQKEEFEEWKREELKKIRAEKKVQDRNKTVLQATTRKEREEIELLRSELQKIKEENKARENRNKLTSERMRKQIEELQIQNREYVEEVKRLEQFRLDEKKAPTLTHARSHAAIKSAAQTTNSRFSEEPDEQMDEITYDKIANYGKEQSKKNPTARKAGSSQVAQQAATNSFASLSRTSSLHSAPPANNLSITFNQQLSKKQHAPSASLSEHWSEHRELTLKHLSDGTLDDDAFDYGNNKFYRQYLENVNKVSKIVSQNVQPDGRVH